MNKKLSSGWVTWGVGAGLLLTTLHGSAATGNMEAGMARESSHVALICRDTAPSMIVQDNMGGAETPDHAVLERYLRLHEVSAGSGVRAALMPWSDLQSQLQ